jgi:hypothetical protein
MTFEIDFKHQDVQYKADVTLSGKDFLVNLTTPLQYETAPTISFTIHDDETMKYDNTLFDDNAFMPAIETAIRNYIHSHKVVVA